MYRFKLTLLYLLLIIFILCGVFAAYQCMPEQQDIPVEEEPYEFEEIAIPVIEVPSDDAEEFHLDYDRAALTAQNEDFYGWLYIPDTEINFPVVFGEDNDFYLNHGFSKAYSAYGCPFLDIRTPPESDNLVVHGHNMGNNRTEIFSTLLYFQDETYANEHNTIYFSCPDREGERYQLFAVCNVDITDDALDFSCPTFISEDSRDEFLSRFQKKSLYPSEDIPDGDILILATCNRTYGGDNRLILIAVEDHS